MDQIYIPLLSALAGAIIGATASVVTIFIQARSQERRDYLRLIADLAMKDHGALLELAKGHEGGAVIPPLAAYLNHHRQVLAILSKRELTPADVANLANKSRELMGAMEEAEAKRRDR